MTRLLTATLVLGLVSFTFAQDTAPPPKVAVGTKDDRLRWSGEPREFGDFARQRDSTYAADVPAVGEPHAAVGPRRDAERFVIERRQRKLSNRRRAEGGR